MLCSSSILTSMSTVSHVLKQTFLSATIFVPRSTCAHEHVSKTENLTIYSVPRYVCSNYIHTVTIKPCMNLIITMPSDTFHMSLLNKHKNE